MEAAADVMRLRFGRLAAMIPLWPMGSDGKSTKLALDATEEMIQSYGKLRLPYLQWDSNQRHRDDAANWKQDWIGTFAGPDDPDGKKAMEAYRQSMAAAAAAQAAQEAEQRRRDMETEAALARSVADRAKSWKDRRKEHLEARGQLD